jgi:hypothetical protein
MNHDQVRSILTTEVKEALLGKENVVAVGTGYKVKDGVKLEQPCVCVLVERKVPQSQLSEGELVPETVEGAMTDVVEVGRIEALGITASEEPRSFIDIIRFILCFLFGIFCDEEEPPSRTERNRPAPGGVSLGHFAITAGTLGCYVKDANGALRVLSNNHVMANSNDAQINDAILQPGTADGGSTPADDFATLEAFKPINFSGGQNVIDAAIAAPILAGDVNLEILEIGIPTGSAEAQLGEGVKKSGRTSGLTTGEVTVIDAMVSVQYGSGKVARFEHQVVSNIESRGGDSGSAVLNSRDQVVGLLFAGSSQTTVLNPIQEVLGEFGVEIATS